MLSACSGGSVTGEDGSGGDGSASGESTGKAKSCEKEEVSVGQSTEKEEKCATIAVGRAMQTNARLAAIAGTIGESITVTLDHELKRATVTTITDVEAVNTYVAMLQLTGGEDNNGELAMRANAAYTDAEIIVTPSIAGDPDGTLIFSINADDIRGGRIGGVSFSGTATALGQSLDSLGKSLAEKIKKARVCLSLTPVRAVINFDDEAKRQQEFKTTVKDLRNEPVNEDKVGYELENAEGGTLSAASVDIANGEAKTTFTMTKKRPNTLTVTYKGRFATQTDTATIIPLCGWLLVIEGDKIFNLDHASTPLIHALLGDGGWLTIKGKSDVRGHVALATDGEEVEVYGTGWMTEKHESTSEAFMYLYSVDGEGRIVGQCHANGTSDATAGGNWLVWGTKAAEEIRIEGLAMGNSPSGAIGFGSCNLAGISASGSKNSGLGVLSEFHNVTMPLKDGATAETSGKGAFLEEAYHLTLTLKRAAP